MHRPPPGVQAHQGLVPVLHCAEEAAEGGPEKHPRLDAPAVPNLPLRRCQEHGTAPAERSLFGPGAVGIHGHVSGSSGERGPSGVELSHCVFDLQHFELAVLHLHRGMAAPYGGHQVPHRAARGGGDAEQTPTERLGELVDERLRLVQADAGWPGGLARATADLLLLRLCLRALLAEQLHPDGLLVPVPGPGYRFPRHLLPAEVAGHDLPGVADHHLCVCCHWFPLLPGGLPPLLQRKYPDLY
mmetsp:Transcript_115465/g.274429  ORF Transcript_115465/g.274429 Transcript_115465/m.274429 type:complete len:243 (-) Transcript_115465:811-1539(-)